MLASKLSEKITRTGTPFYFYDLELLNDTLQKFTAEIKLYGYQAHYALKANGDKRVLDIIKSYGLGADCVSGNEISLALKCGFDPSMIVFAGVGKSDKEIITALKGKIFALTVNPYRKLKLLTLWHHL